MPRRKAAVGLWESSDSNSILCSSLPEKAKYRPSFDNLGKVLYRLLVNLGKSLSWRNGMKKKQKADLLQGTLDLLILKALSTGSMHGYGVGQRIMQLAEEMLKIEEGSLYPALYRLEEKGWIQSE